MGKRFIVSENERLQIKFLYEQYKSDLYYKIQPEPQETTKTKYPEIAKNATSNPSKNAILNKLQIIIPGEGGENYLVQLGKYYGAVEKGVYLITNDEDFENVLNRYINNGNKFLQIIIGSHGRCNQSVDDIILSPTGFGRGYRMAELLSKVTTPESSVYITSCFAADHMSKFFRFSQILGCKVTGAGGVNYFGYGSEKGFVECSCPCSSSSSAIKKYCRKVDNPPFVFSVFGL